VSDDVSDTGDLPDLSPEDEAAVHDLLASLPDPEFPADVETRISAALAAERTAAHSSAAPAALAPTVTVLPDDTLPGRRRHAATPSSGPGRARLLQVAAGVAVLALAGGIAISVGSHHSSGSGAGATVAASAAPTTPPITTSHVKYTDANLDAEVAALLGGPAAATATATATKKSSKPKHTVKSGTSLAATGGTAASSTTQTLSSAVPTKHSPTPISYAGVLGLVTNASRRDACIAALAGQAGVQALAIDVGSYGGRAAAVFVLPDDYNPATIDAWVVGPTCSDADRPFPYSYHELARP